MSDDPKVGLIRSSSEIARACVYVTAIGAGALAGAPLGPWGVFIGTAGLTMACVMDHYRGGHINSGPDEQ